MPRQFDMRAGERPGAAVDVSTGETISAFSLLALSEGDTWIDERGREHTITRRYQGANGEGVVVSTGLADDDL